MAILGFDLSAFMLGAALAAWVERWVTSTHWGVAVSVALLLGLGFLAPGIVRGTHASLEVAAGLVLISGWAVGWLYVLSIRGGDSDLARQAWAADLLGGVAGALLTNTVLMPWGGMGGFLPLVILLWTWGFAASRLRPRVQN